MIKTPATLSTLFVAFALGALAQDKPPLKLVATAPLPKLVGDLEFFAPDIKGNRLFMCAENSGTVEVFDLRTGKWLRSIPGFEAPHDIVYLPDTNNLIVSDGDDDFGWAYLVSGTTYKITDKNCRTRSMRLYSSLSKNISTSRAVPPSLMAARHT